MLRTVVLSGLLRLDVVAVQDVLFPEIKLSPRNRGVGPALVSAGGGRSEASGFLERVGLRLHQGDPTAFSPADEVSIRVGDGALADAAVRPRFLARLEVDALERALV